MTTADEELLFQVLCEYLPYGVKIKTIYFGGWGTVESIRNNPKNRTIIYDDGHYTMPTPLDNARPYLRLMSAMLEEESAEYIGFCLTQYDPTKSYEMFDWLRSHLFDYRGLIEKGLALEAPEGMYDL